MTTINYSIESLERFSRAMFEKMGFSKEEAARITDVLILADLYDIGSHGIQRIIRYYRAIEGGRVKVDSKPEVVFETPVSAVIDGHEAMGQLVSIQAMEMAIEKARKVGMAFVTVRNSNHFGIAGYYTKMACDAGMMGICCTNSESIMVHTGSRVPILGSNPIAFAMPADPYPFWFDAATTVIPKGKLEVYHKAEKPLRECWTVDEEGKPCENAKDALGCIDRKVGGGILPIGGSEEATGGHKGYGFGMICEILCAITSNGATSNHHSHVKGKGTETCHAFIAIDPAIFGDAEAIRDKMSVFLQELRAVPRVDEATPVYTHGEKEAIACALRMKNGVDVDVSTVAEMADICEYLGMDKREYLGDVDLSQAKASLYGKIV